MLLGSLVVVLFAPYLVGGFEGESRMWESPGPRGRAGSRWRGESTVLMSRPWGAKEEVEAVGRSRSVRFGEQRTGSILKRSPLLLIRGLKKVFSDLGC